MLCYVTLTPCILHTVFQIKKKKKEQNICMCVLKITEKYSAAAIVPCFVIGMHTGQ